MLVGILISALVVVVLALGLPWLSAGRDQSDVVDEDPETRFADSMRILRSDVADYAATIDAAEVSTPFTRRAELAELRLCAADAAKRRARALMVLAGLGLATGIAVLVTALSPWWLVAPAVLLLGFVLLARFSVVGMRRRFDARAASVTAGFGEDEDTVTINLAEETEPSQEISVDLAAPVATGSLWEPIPVTAPNYVSKPLVPRTVRTIDLSAPVVAKQPLVPTADRPGGLVDERDPEDATVNWRPRVVGE